MLEMQPNWEGVLWRQLEVSARGLGVRNKQGSENKERTSHCLPQGGSPLWLALSGKGPKFPKEGPESKDSYRGPGGSCGPGSRYRERFNHRKRGREVDYHF